MNREIESNCLSSVDQVINNSFLGRIKINLEELGAFSSILYFETPQIKEILDQVRKDFLTKNTYLSGEDLTTISNKITAAFTDHIVQNYVTTEVKGVKMPLSSKIDSFITQGNGVTAFNFLKSKFKDNLFLNNMRTMSNPGKGGKYLIFKQIDNTTDTRNTMIASIAELMQHPDKQIRDQANIMIATGILQYGTYKKYGSFIDLVPIENYSNFVKTATTWNRAASNRRWA